MGLPKDPGHFPEEMAAVTPRKRKRHSDGLQVVHANPVKKLMMEFIEELPVVKMPTHHGFISPAEQTSSFRDECKENQHSPQRSTRSQKLDTSPLQTANVPRGIRRESPQRMSPESSTTYSSIVPTSFFYSKGKQFQSLLERKLANESHPLRPRNDDGNLPIDNKTETTQIKVLKARKPSSKTSKRPAASRQAKTLPRNTKKAKLEIASPKPVEGKETCAVEKKMDAPFKVLSMKFKPVLKLQTGAAFFATGKKWQSGSKKVLSSPPSLHSDRKSIVKEKQDKSLSHTKFLSTKSKANEAGGKGSHVNGFLKRGGNDNTEEGEKLIQNASQYKEAMCELDNRLLQTSRDCPKVLTQKETDAGTQGFEENSRGSPRNMDKHKNNSSMSSLTDSIHPLFSTPSSNKKRARALPDEQLSLVELSPVVQKAPAIPKASKKTKELSKSLNDQMVIDAGQKHFGATVCKSCGMVYSAANPEDEGHHVQYHQRFLDGIKYVSWKNEHVVAEFWDGKILLILQDDPKYAIKKAEDVRELVDNELGFKQVALTYPSQIQTYLFVSEKKIVGCLIAEPVRQAFRVLSEPTTTLASPTKNNLEHQRAWRCSTKPEKVFCGISRIWVFSLMRRRCIATRLVDVIRRTFLFGSYLGTNEIAFSDPTPDGKLFAAKYCKTPNFLVYNFVS
ncbi:N-acetyltransferase ESCO2 [Elgaria multicarinata webbii]|uniref:N-acetyltransferase ESCO2 n=1 Tax=Elgaria multicarinata webbii TaxID=159646 RepID=UPI002FCD1EFB